MRLVHQIRALRELPETLRLLDGLARHCRGCYGEGANDVHWKGCRSAEAQSVLAYIYGRPAPIFVRDDAEDEPTLP